MRANATGQVVKRSASAGVAPRYLPRQAVEVA